MSARSNSTLPSLHACLAGGAATRRTGRDLVSQAEQDDIVIVIGLALAYARTGPVGDASIPAAIHGRLCEHANLGDPTCGLVLSWLEARHRAGGYSFQADTAYSAVRYAATKESISAPVTPEVR
jgi:hypothetical protein